MKKISLAILILSLTTVSHAAYKMTIGITDKNHGPLPDNSVIFKNANPTTIPEPEIPVVVPPERCFYTQNVYSWTTTANLSAITRILWNGEQITGYPTMQEITTFDSNGYRYTRDEQQTFTGPRSFKICRDLILL